MKQIYFLVVLASISFFPQRTLNAQTRQHLIESIVGAEVKFSDQSRQENTRIAFLNALSSDAILFSPPGHPVNGIEYWTNQTIGPELLVWTPVYADVSQSGDMGYTTGPYQLFRNRTDSIPSNHGYYSSLWKKDNRGNWKVVIDLGIGVGHLPDKMSEFSCIKEKKTVSFQYDLRDFLLVDYKYDSILNRINSSVLQDFFHTNSRVHRHLEQPYVGNESIANRKETARGFHFVQKGGFLSESADMGGTYGQVSFEINTNNKTKVVTVSYFRVWTRDDSGNWKISLDVIGI